MNGVLIIGAILSGILIGITGLIIHIHDDMSHDDVSNEGRIMFILLVALAVNLMILIAYIALLSVACA